MGQSGRQLCPYWIEGWQHELPVREGAPVERSHVHTDERMKRQHFRQTNASVTEWSNHHVRMGVWKEYKNKPSENVIDVVFIDDSTNNLWKVCGRNLIWRLLTRRICSSDQYISQTCFHNKACKTFHICDLARLAPWLEVGNGNRPKWEDCKVTITWMRNVKSFRRGWRIDSSR